jgi:hypothetical protein
MASMDRLDQLLATRVRMGRAPSRSALPAGIWTMACPGCGEEIRWDGRCPTCSVGAAAHIATDHGA